MEKHNLDYFGAFPVERVVLYRSIMGGGADGGSRYEVVGVGKLQPRESAVEARVSGRLAAHRRSP
jgi:hypothetical protein